MKDKIKQIENIVREKLACSAHNMDHVMRVYNMCLHLVNGKEGKAKDRQEKTEKEEENKVDLNVLRASALLHDIARVEEDQDGTGKIDHAIKGAEMAKEILKELDFNEEFIDKVLHCIRSHRFRSREKPQSMEAKIMFDADKVDVLGAIGIARAYSLAGRYGEPLFKKVNMEEYIQQNLMGGKEQGRIRDISLHSPNIEFENKMKKIPNLLHTPRGREIAQERLNYMQDFFLRLEKEVGE